MSKSTSIAAIALAVPALAIGMAGCSFSIGGGDTIDTASLEQELTDQLSKDAGVDPANVSTSCPEDQEAKEGNKFDCTLTAPNGDKVTVNVTLTNDSGGFTAEVPKQK